MTILSMIRTFHNRLLSIAMGHCAAQFLAVTRVSVLAAAVAIFLTCR